MRDVVVGGEIPERKAPGSRVRALSDAPLTSLDIHMAARSSFTQALPDDSSGFIYVIAGEITAGTKRLKEGEIARLDDGDGGLPIQAGPFGARAVLCAVPRS